MRSHHRNRAHEEDDKLLIQLVPELDSEWARSPIAYDRWRRPDECVDNGDACFVPSVKDLGLKRDYIYMPKRKDLEAGYYHLRTQEAYVQVYHRLLQQGPPPLLFSCCRRRCSHHGEEANVSRQQYRKLKRIIYNRVIAKEPDDIQAARMALWKTSTAGGKAAAFGKAAYLPTLTTVLLLNLGGS